MDRLTTVQFGGETRYVFWCPGCEEPHAVNGSWKITGTAERPTIAPSVLVCGENRNGKTRCHSFVRDGKIQFLADSTHQLAGKTVELGPAEG